MHLPQMTDYEKTCREVRFDLPEHYNFGFDLIDERARRADKTACVAVSGDGTAVNELRFSDLARSSARFANVLRTLGAARGDLAFVMIARIPAWYDVLIGCAKAGVVAMPATNLLTPKDVEYRVNAARARFAIVTDDNADKIDTIRAACPSLERCIVVPRPGGPGGGGEAGAGAGARPGWTDFGEAMAAAPDTFEPDRPTRSGEPMLVYFTSGTTSLPKMVPRDHGYALAHVLTGRYWMDLREDDVHWTLSDTGWAKAAWGVLFAPWQMGAAIVLHDTPPGFDADLYLRLVGRLGVTTFCAPPTAYRLFAQADLERYDFGSLRHSLGAGEPLNPEVIKVWEAATGTVIRDGYGQTETINVLANYPALAVRPGSMGKPVPGFDVDVVDDGGRRLAPGEVGHIAVRTAGAPPPGLFDGYLGAPEINAKAFRHGWYYNRRHGHPRRGRLLLVRGARGRRHRLRGIPDQPVRGGERAPRTSLGGGVRGGRPAGRDSRRDRQGLRGARGGMRALPGPRGRDPGLREGVDRPLQVPASDRVSRVPCRRPSRARSGASSCGRRKRSPRTVPPAGTRPVRLADPHGGDMEPPRFVRRRAGRAARKRRTRKRSTGHRVEVERGKRAAAPRGSRSATGDWKDARLGQPSGVQATESRARSGASSSFAGTPSGTARAVSSCPTGAPASTGNRTLAAKRAMTSWPVKRPPRSRPPVNWPNTSARIPRSAPACPSWTSIRSMA